MPRVSETHVGCPVRQATMNRPPILRPIYVPTSHDGKMRWVKFGVLCLCCLEVIPRSDEELSQAGILSDAEERRQRVRALRSIGGRVLLTDGAVREAAQEFRKRKVVRPLRRPTDAFKPLPKPPLLVIKPSEEKRLETKKAMDVFDARWGPLLNDETLHHS